MEQSHFRTLVFPKPKENRLNYQSKTVLIGSCFSSNIANKLYYFKFDLLENPYGILFHPQAILKALEEIILQKEYTESDLVYCNERWHSLNHHSDFSNPDPKQCLTNIQKQINAANGYLKKASHIIITYGTAWQYRYLKTKKTVANCHKIPQREFKKERSTFEELVAIINRTQELVKSFNPNIDISFTLSPVRHLKDGMEENAVSKALLRAAIDCSTKQNQSYYFPSYEMINDDLRDYRFYSSDMIHINEQGIAYIWNQFKNTYIEASEYSTMSTVDSVQKGLLHKPFNPESKAHLKFLKNLKIKMKELEDKNQINFY